MTAKAISNVSSRADRAVKQQSRHLNAGLIIGTLSGLAFYIYTYGVRHVNPVPILGTPSLARPTLGFAAILTLVCFAVVFSRTESRLRGKSTLGFVFNATILSVATTILATSALAILAVGMDDAFKGLKFDIVTASLIVAGVIASLSYLITKFASSITVQRVYVMLVIIMYAGIFVSAIAVDTPDWYNVYLSALGMASAGNSANLFNFVLVFAGIMLITLGNILVDSVSSFYNGHPLIGPTRTRVLRLLFVLAGIFLAGIGAFPYVIDTTQGLLHQLSAGFAGVVFVLWMWLLRYIVPVFDRSFYNFSIGVGISITAIFILASKQIYFNTTGLELSVLIIATAWVGLFLSNMVNVTLSDSVSASKGK